MTKNTKYILVVVFAILLLVVLLWLFNRKNNQEGFSRTPLGNNALFRRSPVDFAMAGEYGWTENPHWIAEPSVKYQPLDFGPIDLYAEERKLNENNPYRIWSQYENNWIDGNKEVYLINDEKTRSLLKEAGDLDTARYLENEYSPRFGPRTGHTNLAMNYAQPDWSGEMFYGGKTFLKKTTG